ncbi:MAG: substrate-binding domain-containing protein [Anaerosacchariphilus sp.]
MAYAEQIEQAGIRLVLADSTMDQPMGSAVVATDNYAAGYKLGSYMKRFVKADSVIGIVGHVKGSSTAVGREAGFRAGLEKPGRRWRRSFSVIPIRIRLMSRRKLF